ncbi:ABC transporter ATP-binding protein [Ruicaihuangia caeni]|uniref:ABC transporter ATP-binding protein n=1 Tax=Ruicaihuangia caeni TaxID=3042517 RepID=UPI00338E1D3B
MNPVPLLSIRGVRHRFGDVVALDGIDLDIQDNEFFALLGPSGCGKTTLLRAIAGFETPQEGSIALDGRSLLGITPNRRPVNLMFQSYALFPHMSVERNVAYGLEAERLDRSEIKRRVAETLEIVGLSALAKRRPAQLSGGQRQRVALARAIVKRPRLLLLDEPLSALDRKVRAEMQLELKRLQHEVGMTFVVVTHDQEEAMSMADRIAVFNDGRLEQLDTPVGLYARPRSRFVAGFIGSANLVDGRIEGSGDSALFSAPGIGRLPLERARAHADDAAVTAVIRPEQLTLVHLDNARPEASGHDLEGTVVDTFFLGGASTVTVLVPGHDEPLACTVNTANVPARGSAIGIRIDLASVVIVPTRASDAVPASGSTEAPVPADPEPAPDVQAVSG